jgi:hypothetical protein
MKRILILIALVVPFQSCGEVVRTGRSPVFLVIDALETANGDKPTQFVGGGLQSDVITIVTSGGLCTQQNPCQIIFNDFGQVTLRTPLKDVTGTSSSNPSAPTTNNEVTLNRYRVVYRRTDGRNVQGVDVPYAFDGALTATIPAGGTLSVAFELVRHVAKLESPLAQLRSNGSLIYTIADVTFFGKDRVGNDIQVTGSIQIDFGNFADRT